PNEQSTFLIEPEHLHDLPRALVLHLHGLAVCLRASHPAIVDRAEAVLLPCVEPAQQIGSVTLEQVRAGDLAAAFLGERCLARQLARLFAGIIVDEAEAHADDHPIGNLARLGRRQPDYHAATLCTIDEYRPRPAVPDANSRRQQSTQAVGERDLREGVHLQRRPERYLRLEDDGAFGPARVPAPDEVAGAQRTPGSLATRVRKRA